MTEYSRSQYMTDFGNAYHRNCTIVPIDITAALRSSMSCTDRHRVHVWQLFNGQGRRVFT